MKKVLITGANKGIGFETARVLLLNGYYVYLGSRTIENGQAAVAKLNAAGLD
jgi:NAD(P)-dependent dehydrogenase (short-subunit alcohol dehydrogenase family)